MLYASGQSRRKFLKTLAGTSVSIGTMPMLKAARKDPAEKASAKLLDETESPGMPLLLRHGRPEHRAGSRPRRRRRAVCPQCVQHRGYRFGLSALAIGASRRLPRSQSGREPGADHAAVSVRTAPPGARLLLSLPGFAHRQADLEERGFFGGYRLAALRGAARERLLGRRRTSASRDELLNRADWEWMLNGSQTLCHGWTPEAGFLPYRWDAYSEVLAMYLLAIGVREAPDSGFVLECLRAAHAGVPGHLLHRCRRAAVRPPVLARVVRLPRPPRQLSRTTSATRFAPRRPTACSASPTRSNFPGTARICGA